MKLNHGLHLAYCTNIHRGESWVDTLSALETHTLKVRDRLEVDEAFAIGLRLSARAARELADPSNLDAFRHWLDRHGCYVFTINGFPYGDFHGTRVKEQVYFPDWTSPDRLEYTNRLFDILSAILPDGVTGSVSTLPGSFKAFITTAEQQEQIFTNLAACARHIAMICDRLGQDLHLGLEPEPLGLFETSSETVEFFEQFIERVSPSERGEVWHRIGVNYDTCHLAAEFENADEALGRLADAGIRISKIHLSSALRCTPDTAALEVLRSYAEDTYLHQVIVARGGEVRNRYADVDAALAGHSVEGDEEWRVHFHVPLHAAPEPPLTDTRDHIAGTLDWLAADPSRCSHLEMETYTWEVLPAAMKSTDVVDQLVREYRWTLAELDRRRLA